MIDPISGPLGTLEYSHNVGGVSSGESIGIGIIGGFVYRGTKIPELIGKYVFGDLALVGTPTRIDGRLFYADLVTGEIKEFLSPDLIGPNGSLPNQLTVHGFGEDANGELYAAGYQYPGKRNGRDRLYAHRSARTLYLRAAGHGSSWFLACAWRKRTAR